jgi:hypothetical protein
MKKEEKKRLSGLIVVNGHSIRLNGTVYVGVDIIVLQKKKKSMKKD